MKVLLVGSLVAGLLAFSPAAQAQSLCPQGMNYYKGICWKYLIPPTPTWQQVCLHCKVHHRRHHR